MANQNQFGTITAVMGPVVDVSFEGSALPPIKTALQTSNPFIGPEENNLVLEVALHLGDNQVRAISMDTTDGLIRGSKVLNTGNYNCSQEWMSYSYARGHVFLQALNNRRRELKLGCRGIRRRGRLRREAICRPGARGRCGTRHGGSGQRGLPPRAGDAGGE